MIFDRLLAALHIRARRGSDGGSRRSEAALARWLRRAVLAIGVAGLLVLPQFVSNASFLGVRGLPGPVVVLLVGFAFWLMPVLLVASWAAEGRAAVPRPWLAIPAGLFIAGAVVSTAFAADKSSAMVRAAELAGLWVGMFALAQVLRTDAERRLAVAALVAACLVAGSTAIYQAAYDLPRTWEYFQEHRAEVLAQYGIEPGGWGEQMFIGRFTGGVQATLGHPNVLAAFLTLGFFAALGLAREKWSEAASRGARAMAAMVAGAAVVCAVGIVLAQARAAMVSVGVGVYWLAVAWWVGRPRLRRILYAAPLVLGAAGLAVAAVVNHPATVGALASLKVRLDYWQPTAEILRRHGATGVGLENFGLHYLQFKLPTAPEEVADPHNFFLSTWSMLGLAGLAALVSVWVIAIRAWRRRGVETGPCRGSLPGAGWPGHAPLRGHGDAEPEEHGHAPLRGHATRPDGMPPGNPQGGEPLAGLLAPVLVLAAPAVVYFSVTGLGGDWKSGVVLGMIGAGVAAVMVLAMGVAAAEEPSRLAVAGRPFRSLRSACVVGLLAFALQEQIGTAVLEPPTAWAMLVLLAVTLSTRDEMRARRGFVRRTLVAEGGSGGRSEHPEEARPDETGRGTAGVKLGVALKFLLMAAAMTVAFLYISRLVLPVGREAYLLRLAANPMASAERDETYRGAAAANPLAWEPAMMRGHAWQEEAGLAQGPSDAMALAQAVAGYQDALAREPRLRRACLALAGCNLAAEGALDNPSALGEARRSLDRAVALYPTDLVARLWLAHAIDRLGDREAALAAYREVLRLDGLMPEPKRRLPSEVRVAAEGRVKELAEGSPGPPYPGDLPIRLYLAMQMERLGCTVAAYWAYREVLDLDSRLAEPRRLSADVRRAVETRLGQLAGAMTGASPGPGK
jgi:tetratricopeptide (TPR) repeat protein